MSDSWTKKVMILLICLCASLAIALTYQYYKYKELEVQNAETIRQMKMLTYQVNDLTIKWLDYVKRQH